ncbi:RNase HII [Aerococcus urinaehominis]|nr:RNase HII [Aerococcus urinaehominis]
MIMNEFKSMTVGQVKSYLTNLQGNNQDLSQADRESLVLDSRKGVHQALTAFDRQRAKESLRRAHIQAMRSREEALMQAGYQVIAGVDEVGRGPLAGPVVACALVLPADMPLIDFDDSKQVSLSQRQKLVAAIDQYAIDVQVAEVSAQQIDETNILQATKAAMSQAILALCPRPDMALIDAVSLPTLTIDHQAIIKGDASVYSIAAASIYAKVYRDRLMAQYHDLYPAYDFINNAGYGTKKHLAALAKFGPCPIHRLSFAPVKAAIR